VSTKGIADVVFCLDISESMSPCIQGVRDHVVDFIQGLQSNQQMKWDIRMDFVAHCAGESSEGNIFYQRSLYNEALIETLYLRNQSGRYFTDNLEEFRQGLNQIRTKGDEAALIGLDSCLDFPWRDSSTCHRIVIMMTDEAFETGVCQQSQRELLHQIIKKINQLRIMLFIVAPESAVFDELSSADKSEYEVIEETGQGLSQVDFRKVLSYIGKSVSVSTLQTTKPDKVIKGLFGQGNWGHSDVQITGS
jgi:hypothetical protein